MAETGERYKAERIVNMLREIDVKTTSGKTIPGACKQIGISEQTGYRRRKIYGALKAGQKVQRDRNREVQAAEAGGGTLVARSLAQGSRKRKLPRPERKKDAPFCAEIIRLACVHERYDYRMIVGLMRNAEWQQATAVVACG